MLSGYSIFQITQVHADKLDTLVRQKLLCLCQTNKHLDKYISKNKRLSVIIEFNKECFGSGCMEMELILCRHKENRIQRYFSRVNCCSVDVTPEALGEALLFCPHIKKVYLNREVKALLDVAVPAVHAKGITRNGTELSGEGVKIAVIDTGIYPHPDLADRITDFVDFINNRIEPYDDNGHGTHCAGCAASASPKYRGPAPKAQLAGVKVLNKAGKGSVVTVMQGIEWCIQYNERNHARKIDIISLSLSMPAQNYGAEAADPLVKLVVKAWEAGITVCVSAGNGGPRKGTIGSPGISKKVITVGSFDDRKTTEKTDDNIARFSSRGPTLFNVEKPDILAPGVNIVSLRSPNSYLDRREKYRQVEDDYFMMSGTSMATPICAGIVALVKETNPKLKPEQIKKILISSTDLWQKEDGNVYGAGRINAEQAIKAASK